MGKARLTVTLQHKTLLLVSNRSVCWSRFTICGDACPLSCVNAEACLTGWPNARVRRGGGS